ncbi:DMT family transporter [Prauserella cavernicola]|uniref:DMT family transporter n=1 Tax=Prauserella cavernicola TaxID=2800127 RepID=A0A934QZM8_9PSEU|nr:DMT family transporter [Prauserella cavernicola]MBK1788198.1 DMT family transporter [Prauserella cavernicola]
MLVPVFLGFTAAFLFAASAALQRRAVLRAADSDTEHRAARHQIPVVWLVRRLLTQRVWLIGWATNLLGFVTQAAALHLGSIALVQPLLVTQLLFALPMASATIRRWPTLRDWLAALAVTGGVALILTVEGAAPLAGSADRDRLFVAVLVAAATVVTLVQLAQRGGPLLYGALIAASAGICYAISAAMMKLTADSLLDGGVLATALDWPGYVLAVSTLCGLLLGQQAYGSGSLSAAIAVMSIVNPAASYTLGLLAFHASPSTQPAALAASAAAASLLIIGVVGLAHSPTVQQETSRTTARGIYPDRGKVAKSAAARATHSGSDTCPQ